MHPAIPAGPIAVLAAALAITACGTFDPPAHHPASPSVLRDCRQLRTAVLADAVLADGVLDARTVLHLLAEHPGKAGAIHGDHGLTMDLDWMYSAVTAGNRGTAAGKRFTGRQLAALAGDCRRAAGVVIPLRG